LPASKKKRLHGINDPTGSISDEAFEFDQFEQPIMGDVSSLSLHAHPAPQG
tara:strand:+ start:148 stop:300 length:153 start_codon:yes stop_codon:yes gene_type:complete